MMRKIYLLALSLFLTFSINAQQNIELAGELYYPDGLSDIWGYTDATGIEYALVCVKGTFGQTGGLSVVSLEDPENPEEVYYKAGSKSTWRDVKEYNGFAYVVLDVESSDEGLLIVDLNSLPDETGITDTTWHAPGWEKAHNVFIDENGVMYIGGANEQGSGGVIMYDITNDPKNPEYLGEYQAAYVHDVMARGDTMYTGNVYAGTFSVVDVSDKENPVYLGGAETPDSFCHNVWVSDDGDYVYTTDEVGDAYIAGFDISDLDDVEETDRIQYDPGSNTIVHNTFFINNYLVTSYYKAGVTIHDVTDPWNMIQVGHYDTSPLSGDGFNGAWGVYPYFESETIVVSDISEGLFVLTPSYTRASRLEGQITDGPTGDVVFDAEITVLDIEVEKVVNSDVSGMYKTGMAESGFWDVMVSHDAYADDVIVEGVEFVNGEVTILNVVLGDVSNAIDENSIWGQVKVYPNPVNDQFTIALPAERSSEKLDVVITDLTGKLVYKEGLSGSENTFRLTPDLEKGMYIVSLHSSKQVLFKTKIFISK